MTQPTLEELLACLGEQQAPEGYRTAAEWSTTLGVSPRRLRQLLDIAHKQSKLSVRHEYREAIDLRQARVPVYRFDLTPS